MSKDLKQEAKAITDMVALVIAISAIASKGGSSGGMEDAIRLASDGVHKRLTDLRDALRGELLEEIQAADAASAAATGA